MRRFFGGLLLVLHGLAHAVLPERGHGGIEPSGLVQALAFACWSLALVGCVAAGVGVWRARPFRAWWPNLALLSSVTSLAAIALARDGSLWFGAVGDFAVLWVLVSQAVAPPRELRVVLPPPPEVLLGRKVRDVLGFALVAYVAATAAVRPWSQRWNVTDDELARALPGDDAATRVPALEVNRAVTVDAPPAQVWRWLAGLAADPRGLYHSPALQEAPAPAVVALRPGDVVRAAPAGYLGGVFEPLDWSVRAVEAGKGLVFGDTAFALVPLDGGARTRLLVRTRVGGPHVAPWAGALTFTAFELPHFLAERRLLLELKERAEADARARPEPPTSVAREAAQDPVATRQ